MDEMGSWVIPGKLFKSSCTGMVQKTEKTEKTENHAGINSSVTDGTSIMKKNT